MVKRCEKIRERERERERERDRESETEREGDRERKRGRGRLEYRWCNIESQMHTSQSQLRYMYAVMEVLCTRS